MNEPPGQFSPFTELGAYDGSVKRGLPAASSWPIFAYVSSSILSSFAVSV